MQARVSRICLFGALCALQVVPLLAQGQALYFNGVNQYAEFTAPPDMPAGTAERTVEFWLRSDLSVGARDNHQSIVELGEQAHNGSAFGIFSEIGTNGRTFLSFWGHNADSRFLAELPDDQWVFVAVTYRQPTLMLYLNAELAATREIVTAVGGQRLDTRVGRVYVGGFPSRGWFFQGAVDGLVIWNRVRSPEEIKRDMIPFPCLAGGEPNLVAAFQFNEGAGAAFSDQARRLTGSLVNGSQWTRKIEDNPSPLSEGIWFVIQNKSDVDADREPPPARRLALRSNGTAAPTMAQIPLDGSYDEFLWTALPSPGGRYKLFNKKLGRAYALDSGQTDFTIGSSGNYSGQSWQLTRTDLSRLGTNTYRLSNDFITAAKAYALDSGRTLVAASDPGDARQSWVLQPMGLVSGYHVPATPAADCPTTKKLVAQAGIAVYGTNTTSDWAMLNTHLIIGNMTLAAPSSCSWAGQRIYIITRYDFDPDLISRYPQVGIPSAWIGDTRGGQHPGHNLTMVTEEMMCKVGVHSRGTRDTGYREFDQVVHEFGHTIDVFCQQAGGNTPACPLNDPRECYAAAVQAWFDNNFSYPSFARTRPLLRAGYPTIYQHLERGLSSANTWLPPRKLRNTR